MKFNINEYKGKFVMHCKTEEEAIDFCNYLHSIGRRWRDGSLYKEYNCWYSYEHNTCYNFNQNSYTDINWSKRNNFIILEWSDYMKKNFTKADLKTGDVVLRKNGNVEIVVLETGTLVSSKGFMELKNLLDDLTEPNDTFFDSNTDWDIIAVRRPTEPYHCQFDAFRCGLGRLVYERKEPEEMTLEQVCKELGREIKIVKG